MKRTIATALRAAADHATWWTQRYSLAALEAAYRVAARLDGHCHCCGAPPGSATCEACGALDGGEP